MTELYFFDLLGVFAFSLFGAYVGLSKKFDLFGIFICALLSSLGGGTIREVMLGNVPVYLTDYIYFIFVAFGMAVAIPLYTQFHKIKKYFLIIDAIGLSTFAFIGAQRAAELHLSAIAIIFFATITAVGGGILRDIAMREIPSIFHKDFYATPAIILGVFYVLGKEFMPNPLIASLLIVSIFMLRILAIHYKFQIWSRK